MVAACRFSGRRLFYGRIPINQDNAGFFMLYVNSWGRDKKRIIVSRVGVKAPARFLCIAEEDSVSEIAEVAHPKANPFQDFRLVVAAFNEAI